MRKKLLAPYLQEI